MKTTTQDFEAAKKKEVSVSFGKSTTYEVIQSDDQDDGSFTTADLKGKGSPRPMKRIIDEKDISDGRNEEEKIKDQLEREEKEQLEEIRKMTEWRKKQEEKEKETEGKNSIID